MIHFFLYCFRWGDAANFCAFVAANVASAPEKAVKVGKMTRIPAKTPPQSMTCLDEKGI